MQIIVSTNVFLINLVTEEKGSWRSDIEEEEFRVAVKGESSCLSLSVIIEIVSPLRLRVGFGLLRIVS